MLKNPFDDEFRVRDGWTTFVFTPTLDANALWKGVQGFPDAIGVVRSGMDHEVLMPAGWSTIEVDVADRLIDSEGLLPARVFASASPVPAGSPSSSSGSSVKCRQRSLGCFRIGMS